MFLGYGQPVIEERLRYYGNLTQFIPLDVFKASCRQAALETVGSFPPGPGDILKAALQLAPGAYTPGQGYSTPIWYQRQRKRMRIQEQPKELGPRTGMTRVDVITDGRLS